MQDRDTEAKADKLPVGSNRAYPRLPCRGCMASCANYADCEGYLWRMAPMPAAKNGKTDER
jgi:hypothetical protein